MTPPSQLDGDATEIGDDFGPDASASRSMSSKIPEPGERVAHFLVEELLGIGGMGVVLRAKDERLTRRVALKLMRPELGLGTGDGRTRGTERLLVEARAMAKINHPNVITVYEVGVVEGQVFLAMEFIDGQTLGDWVEAERPSWMQLVEHWLAAGRGLAAAHAAKLVHRDFKPANVLVSRDARVLVTDFGIAGDTRVEPSGISPMPKVLETHDELSRSVSHLTQTGSLLGTPRYMAPEQFVGQQVDARADQFAFAVSLWEAAYGRHPFDAANVAALALAVSTGDIREPPRGHGVPDRLRRLLLRALATKPEQRYPDMQALLDELEALLRSLRRRRWLLPALALVPALALGVWALWPEPPQPPDPCALDEQRWAGIWDAELDAQLAHDFAQADAPYVRESWTLVRTRLDRYTSDWDEHQRRACEDTRVRETVSAQMLDRRMACLDTRRRRVAALTEQLLEGDPDQLARALEVATRLPALDDCDELARLEADAELPPEAMREQLDRFDALLAQATTRRLSGDPEGAVALLEPWAEPLAEIGYPKAQSQRHHALGMAWSGNDDTRTCEHYRKAYAYAVAGRALQQATDSALELVTCRADSARDDLGEFWLEIATAGYDALERPRDYAYFAGEVMFHRGRRDDPRALEAARLAWEHADESDDHERLTATANYGSALVQLREFEQGRIYLEQAIELSTRVYGPHHPTTLKWRTNLIATRLMEGKDYAGVLKEAQAVLELQDTSLGSRDAIKAVTLTIIGVAARQLGDPELAVSADRRAFEIRKRVFGEDNALTVESLEKLGRDYMILGDDEAGIDSLRQVIEMLARNKGPENIAVGHAWGVLGWALRTAERIDEAVEAQRRGLEIIRAAAPDHPTLFQAHAQLGNILVEAGKFAAAEPELLRAYELGLEHQASPRTSALTLFDLARAIHGQRPRDPAVLERAHAALKLLEEDPDAPTRKDIEAWLAEEGLE